MGGGVVEGGCRGSVASSALACSLTSPLHLRQDGMRLVTRTASDIQELTESPYSYV